MKGMEGFIQGPQGLVAHGSVAQRLLASGMNVNALRTNALLRKEEWQHFDEAVIKAAQQRMVGVADLKSRGLTYSLTNGLGTMVLAFEDQSDMTDAEISMDGVTRGRNDRIEYSIKYLPLPIIHKSFQINARVLAASRNLGQPLDTTQAELAGIKVADMVENILFNGYNSFAYGGGTLYGYTDCPTRNTVTMVKKWTLCTGEEILDDVRLMKQTAINDRHYGPFVLYIPTAYETLLDDDFKAASDRSLRERILAIQGIEDIKVSDKLAVDNVVLVEMNSQTVRMVEGLPVTNVEWQTEGNMISHFKVMTIDIPQVRADQDGRSGIVHLAYEET